MEKGFCFHCSSVEGRMCVNKSSIKITNRSGESEFLKETILCQTLLTSQSNSELPDPFPFGNRGLIPKKK
jgi:hypothetical protein